MINIKIKVNPLFKKSDNTLFQTDDINLSFLANNSYLIYLYIREIKEHD